MALSNLTVRNYKQEDSSSVIGLYEHSFTQTPHFVRNKTFLNHFMRYPGVDEKGTFVAEVDGKIIGFAIVSVTTEGGLKQGNIIELQVKDAQSMRALIQTVLDYCRIKDVDTIVVVPPPLPRGTGVFKDWLKLDMGVMMTRALSLSSLLKALLSTERIRSLYAGKQVAFHIGAETVKVEITPKEINIDKTESESGETFAHISMSLQVFQSIIFGHLNSYFAYLTRKVRVRGTKNTFQILKLLRTMKIASPFFFTSLADRM